MKRARPWFLGLIASTVFGSCCVICIPLPHPGDAPSPAPLAVR
jgi:hypothetical protein